MAAVFPRGIKSFVRHRNLVDDVKAEHINAIQDEVVAIQTVLGPLVQEVEEISSDVEDLEDEQVGDNRTERVFRARFKSLGERLKWIQDGGHIQGAELAANALLVPPRGLSGIDPGFPYHKIKFDRPPDQRDPRRMYNGTGLTLRRGGLWLLTANVAYAINGLASNEGVYQAQISINDSRSVLPGTAQQHTSGVEGWDDSLFLNPTVLKWLPRGTRVYLRTAHSTNKDQRVQAARLSAVRVRGFESFQDMSPWPLPPIQ